MHPSSDDFVALLTVIEPTELPHVLAMLEAAEIPSFVRSGGVQHLFGAGVMGTGHDLITGPPVVMVPASRLDEARQVLADATRAD